ncbi:efflux RND transporter permease subunit [Escherichia coli]
MGRKIIRPWRAITANLLPGSPSNWLPSKRLDTSRAVKEELNRLSAYFPASLKTVYPYDTTPFIEISIQEVFKTLVEAIILVFAHVSVFAEFPCHNHPDDCRTGGYSRDV